MSAPHQPGGPSAPKKTSPWIFVLIGCAGMIVIAGVAMVALGFFAVNKAKEAGLDPDLLKEQPALAAAKMMAAANPDIEVVDVDEGAGKITFREVKTGKTVTLNVDEIKQGKISFESSEGETLSMEATGSGSAAGIKMESGEGTYQMGAGAVANLPDWLPTYPGTEPAGVMSQDTPEYTAGAANFTTTDSIADVMNFYKEAMEDAGLEVNVVQHSGASMGAMVTGESADKGRSAGAIIAAGDNGTSVNLTFKNQK